MKYYIIVFKNTLDAMTAEKELQNKQIVFKMMPTPTSITQSCGLCIRLTEKNDIDKIIQEDVIKYKKIYIKEDNSYREI